MISFYHKASIYNLLLEDGRVNGKSVSQKYHNRLTFLLSADILKVIKEFKYADMIEEHCYEGEYVWFVNEKGIMKLCDLVNCAPGKELVYIEKHGAAYDLFKSIIKVSDLKASSP